MATYVERAILQISDQSSGPVRKLNSELAKLFATAKKLGQVKGKINIDASGVSKASKALNSFASSANKISNKKIKLSVNVDGISQANRRLDQLNAKTLSTKKLRIETVYTDRGNGGGNPGNSSNSNGGGTAPIPVQNTPRPGRQSGQGSVPLVSSGRSFGAQAGHAFNSTARGNLIGQAIGVTFMAYIKYNLAATIARGISDGMVKGTRQIDLSGNRFKTLNVNDADRASYTAFAAEQSKLMPQYNQAQIASVIGELASGYRTSDETKTVTAEVLRFANERILTGQTSEQALQGAFKVIKGLETSNQIRDAEGNLDKNMLNRFMNVIIEESRSSGAEISPELIAQIFKYSRTQGRTVTPEGFRTSLIFGEELGQSIGNMSNQLVKQLTGKATKKALDAQAAAGLIETQDVTATDKNGKKKTTTQFKGIVDEDLLRQDAAAWFEQRVIPLLQKNKINMNDATAVSKFLAPMFSNATAEDLANKLTVALGEIQQRVEQARGVEKDDGRPTSKTGYDTSLVGQQKIIDESIVNQFDTVVSQLVSLFGNLAESTRSGLIPAFQTVTSLIQQAIDFVQGPGGEPSAARSTAVVGGGLAAAGLAFFGGKTLLGSLTGLAPNTLATLANTGALSTLTGTILTGGLGAAAGGAGAAGAAGAAGGLLKGSLKKLGLAGLIAGLAYGAYSTFGSGQADKGPDGAGSNSAQWTDAGASIAAAFAAYIGGTAAMSIGGTILGGIKSAATSTPVGRGVAAAIAAIVAVTAMSDPDYRSKKDYDPARDPNIDINRAAVKKVLDSYGPMEGGRQRREVLRPIEESQGFPTVQLLDSTLASGSSKISDVLNNGTGQIEGAVAQLPAVGSSFGTAAGGVLATFGGAFGSAAGAAISAAVANIRVNVNSPQTAARPSSDTGIQSPN